LFYLLALFLI